MKTNLFKFTMLLVFSLGMFFTSCTDSSESTDAATAEDYSEEVVTRTRDAAALGKGGCYELVFPVTVVFADSTTAEVDSYEALKAAIKAWRVDNPDVKTRPQLAYPFDVINDAGEVITVTDATVQKELRALCGKSIIGGNHGNGHGQGGHGGQGGHDNACFKINFPFSVSLPDSTIITLNSKEDRKTLHDAIKEYRKNNPGVRVHPELVFPITVTMEDGTVVTVNTREELKALKESCD